uniref:hypothetical protein n=1 Tax=Candidatus Ventrenecus sp. TaxID=3085654 RepID=UPI003FF13713
MENKPSVLYRGLKVDYNSLQNFEFSGVDLKVNYAPIIDQYGRKTVTDGNEYGVYMSDNLSMVTSAYGDLHHDGIPIHNNLSIYNERIMIPSVAVIYRINTNGLDVRKPFIVGYLKGHYNNGFQGDEWIADIVPASNYELYRVRIGADILHDAEDIDLSKKDDISERVKQKLEMRKYRLETFANAMERMSPIKRNAIGRDELNILKSIYGQNGLKYINEDSLITSDVDGMLRYLVAKTFRKNESDIDFQTIRYINGLKGQAISVDSIIEILKNDKIKNMQDKVSFEERKKQEGVSYVTSKFDKQEKRLDGLMSMVLLRRKKDNQYKQEQSQANTSINENKTREDQEWEMIKEKYDYDELEPERQQTIEKSFREMIYKRRISEIGIDDNLLDDITEETEMTENAKHSGKRMM